MMMNCLTPWDETISYVGLIFSTIVSTNRLLPGYAPRMTELFYHRFWIVFIYSIVSWSPILLFWFYGILSFVLFDVLIIIKRLTSQVLFFFLSHRRYLIRRYLKNWLLLQYLVYDMLTATPSRPSISIHLSE